MLSRYSVAAVALLAASASAVGNETSPPVSEAYDFIIVGGGTAGTALATRLSQRLPDSTILLIEAGPAANHADIIDIPALRGTAGNTVFDWNLTSTPQPALNNQTLSLPRGHVLGGSSALNFMAWTKASAAEYDAWETLGNPGWNWTTMSEHMMRAEAFSPSSPVTADGVVYDPEGCDGTEGPIKTLIDRLEPEYEAMWFPTMANLGVEENSSPSGGNISGASLLPTAIDGTHYVRSYSANSYLPLAGSNLQVVLNTRVAKLNLAPLSSNGTSIQQVTGVTLTNGTIITANNEVILSAGSYQSPGLLELSGIGQPSVLAAAGVEQVVIDLPGVGENLQDHVDMFISYQLKPEYRPGFDTLATNATYAAEQLALWQNGSLSQYDQSDKIYAFVDWDQMLANASQSLVALAYDVVLGEGSNATAVDRQKLAYLSDKTVMQVELELIDGYVGTKGYPSATSPLYGATFLTIFINIMHPLARGTVHITSSTMEENGTQQQPRIDGRWLSNAYDMQAAVAALQYARRIANTEPLASAWVAEYEPGVDEVVTEAQWAEYVRDTAGSTDHPSGTCAMLPLEDGGVVDPRLVVYGTANLRVVDASVIPIQPSAHIQTAVYGIAEMAADFIVEDWS